MPGMCAGDVKVTVACFCKTQRPVNFFKVQKVAFIEHADSLKGWHADEQCTAIGPRYLLVLVISWSVGFTLSDVRRQSGFWIKRRTGKPDGVRIGIVDFR